ncbi:MAG: alanine dehydrogenase [Ignavibacteria bacterium]|nr:alanine dehydrogenase [Ignavibacteria bacterium]
MNIGILKEDPKHERRVALTPAGVHSLIENGHKVYIEKDAGFASRFYDNNFKDVGANLVYTPDEIYGRSELVLKVSSPNEVDCERLEEEQTLFSFLHLAIAKKKILTTLLEKNITSIGFELTEDNTGNLPILGMMSEVAGQMSIQIAARFLENTNNGRGIVLGGVTGVPPATVLILGAGIVGQTAARVAIGAGAEVIVLDKDLNRLRVLENRHNFRVITGMANHYNIKKALLFADVVVGAVLIKGERAPHLISEEMVRQMKPGSIIIDLSIDQGGCIETSHPTTLENPTYVQHDVIHYCVPNIPANVSRTATYALTNALLPFVELVADNGVNNALKEHKGLARGVCTFNGNCTNEAIARRFDKNYIDIQEILSHEL